MGDSRLCMYLNLKHAANETLWSVSESNKIFLFIFQLFFSLKSSWNMIELKYRLGSRKPVLAPPPTPSFLILTVPRRYFCCGSLLLLVLAVRIYTLVHVLCEWHILDRFRQLNNHLSGKELFIRFTARAFRKLLSIYVFSHFHFGLRAGYRIWLYQFLIIAYLFLSNKI